MKKIELKGKHGKGLYTFVDDEDYAELSKYNWYLKVDKRWIHNEYAIRFEKVNGKNKVIRMHRQILKAPKSMLVDHISGNGLMNIRSNLRLCTPAENSQHSRSHRKYSTSSDYKGVYLHKDKQVWMARISHNCNYIYLGIYNDQEMAARVYDSAARVLHGKFAITNFNKDYKRANKIAEKFIKIINEPASKYRGVAKNGNNWRATIWHNKIAIRLGTFKTEQQAALAYNALAEELLGDKAKLNVVVGV